MQGLLSTLCKGVNKHCHGIVNIQRARFLKCNSCFNRGPQSKVIPLCGY